jgi:hypothetical protein
MITVNFIICNNNFDSIKKFIISPPSIVRHTGKNPIDLLVQFIRKKIICLFCSLVLECAILNVNNLN